MLRSLDSRVRSALLHCVSAFVLHGYRMSNGGSIHWSTNSNLQHRRRSGHSRVAQTGLRKNATAQITCFLFYFTLFLCCLFFCGPESCVQYHLLVAA